MHLNIIHLPSRKDRFESLQKELSAENIVDYTIWDGIIDPYVTAKGISQAHKQVVQYAKNLNLEEVLIAEDDFKFTDRGAYNFFLENKPKDFDIYLASIYFGKINEMHLVNDFSGLTFYIIKKRFYDFFLSIPEHNDIDRSLRNTGIFAVCNPFTVVQQNGFSDNKKEFCDYSTYLSKRKLYVDGFIS